MHEGFFQQEGQGSCRKDIVQGAVLGDQGFDAAHKVLIGVGGVKNQPLAMGVPLSGNGILLFNHLVHPVGFTRSGSPVVDFLQGAHGDFFIAEVQALVIVISLVADILL